MCAGGLVDAMFPGPIASVNTLLAPGVSIAQGLFIEMFLTMILIFTVLMLAAEKSKDTFIAPIGIGLALFVAEIAGKTGTMFLSYLTATYHSTGVYYTGGSLNPARSFGCAVAARSFPRYHWIYWLGPFMGSMFTAGYYRLIKLFNYEEANPDQDSTGEDF